MWKQFLNAQFRGKPMFTVCERATKWLERLRYEISNTFYVNNFGGCSQGTEEAKIQELKIFAVRQRLCRKRL